MQDVEVQKRDMPEISTLPEEKVIEFLEGEKNLIG
jgi:hypothetical protein